MSKKDISDEDLMYTFSGLYGQTPPAPAMLETQYGDLHVQKQGELAHATTVPTTTVTSGGGSPSKTTHVKPMKPPKATQSAATSDPIKTSKSNSNIVKHKDEIYIYDQISIKDQLSNLYDTVKDKTKSQKKITMAVGAKLLYDDIKREMLANVEDGANAACKDIGVEFKKINISHDILSPLDKLRDSVVNLVMEDEKNINRASLRVATASKTEAQRSWNYGYAKALMDNGINKAKICSSSDSISDDSSEFIGSEIELNDSNLLSVIPPFRPNSKLKIMALTTLKDEVINNTVDNLKNNGILNVPDMIVDKVENIGKSINEKIINRVEDIIVTKVEDIMLNRNEDINIVENKCLALEDQNSKLEANIVELQDSLEKISAKTLEEISSTKDETSKNLEKVISFFTELQESNKTQTNELISGVLKYITDMKEKEIAEKKVNKTVVPVRDDNGKIVSYKIEES
jgi:hypothetical protein